MTSTRALAPDVKTLCRCLKTRMTDCIVRSPWDFYWQIDVDTINGVGPPGMAGLRLCVGIERLVRIIDSLSLIVHRHRPGSNRVCCSWDLGW